MRIAGRNGPRIWPRRNRPADLSNQVFRTIHKREKSKMSEKFNCFGIYRPPSPAENTIKELQREIFNDEQPFHCRQGITYRRF